MKTKTLTILESGRYETPEFLPNKMWALIHHADGLWQTAFYHIPFGTDGRDHWGYMSRFVEVTK